ncbi:MAG: carbohydrate kinase family protein [Sedimentisphaerales bacterium]|nr:carbohydrate kinase family protein [Sedimentisphaerales bacterium]
MSIDVLVLNTAVIDLRHEDFSFVDSLVGEGGLVKGETAEMPEYSQEQFKGWLDEGRGAAGGPGNTAPLLAKAGLKTAVGVNLGQGQYDGFDACGRAFYDAIVSAGVDMSATFTHGSFPTGITFIHDKPGKDRGGLAYFPNCNNDFSFSHFKGEVERLQPRVVHYMYAGLSRSGDANGGRDLAEFIKWCRSKGIVTIVDCATMAGDPASLIASGKAVEDYRLLEPVLPEVDVFFTSGDECKMIENTLAGARQWDAYDENENCTHFLEFLAERFWDGVDGTRMFGVTVGNGAYQTHRSPDGVIGKPVKTTSRFMAGGAVDLVGAGDSFRAGMLTYLANNLDGFRAGTMDFERMVQSGNLMASLYVKAPLNNRCVNITSYEKLQQVVGKGKNYDDFAELLADLA